MYCVYLHSNYIYFKRFIIKFEQNYNKHNLPTLSFANRHFVFFLFLQQIFASKSELQLHSQLHVKDVKPYKCHQCNKTFANSSYLSQHTRIHLGIKPYRCDICQRRFTQLSHLQQHIRTHTGDKPYKCRHPGCTKAFSQLSNLQSHSRCHQTDKPFKCNSCYKCFQDEQSLLEHIPKHKESKHLKTHICQYCGKSYTQETYLSKHMQKHAERMDKRPPIIGIPRVALENGAYWGKMSPDTANNLVEAINQQQQQQECMQGGGGSGGSNGGVATAGDLNAGGPSSTSASVSADDQPSNRHGAHLPPAPPEYLSDTSSVPKTSTSAFTPIQSFGLPTHPPPPPSHHPHHPHHQQHHQQTMYMPYNHLSFSGAKQLGAHGHQLSPMAGPMDMKPPSVGSVPNGFPNQLISLHHIRNYSHQPSPSSLMSEHLLHGMKDKVQ